MRLRVLGIVLAGGKGTRLFPLTKERAKPAVPFGGKYRVVDFVLSNFINSGIYSIYVLTQFKSQSLLQHLSEGWQFGSLLKNQFLIPVPAQMRSPGETWYRGTADAIYQNVNLIEQSDPHLVAIFGADHIYRMNFRSMVEYHEQKRADVTVAAIPVDRRLATEFGVIETARDGHVVGFHEKRADAPAIPGDPTRVYASMGNYIFSARVLLRELYADAAQPDSSHDFGRDILPSLVDRAHVFAYDFQTNEIPGEDPSAAAYWRDVGTLDAYYEANMDLRSGSPSLNLIVSGGCILAGGTVRNSVLSRWVRVESGALVEDSVILDNCEIGRDAKIRRAILDKNVRVAEGLSIGYDLDQDRKLHHVTESGIVVVEGLRSALEISTVVV